MGQIPASADACMPYSNAAAVLVADVMATLSADAPLESTVSTESTEDVTTRQLALAADGLYVVIDGAVLRIGMLSANCVCTPAAVPWDSAVSTPDKPAFCAGAVPYWNVLR